MFKIDIHNHVLPHSRPDLKERYGYGGWIRLDHLPNGNANMMKDETFFREIEPNCFSIEARLKDCDTFGVDVQVLSTVPVMFGYWAKPEDALDLAQLLNDDLAASVAKYPTRLTALGSAPMQAPELAAQELRRCVTELNFPGMQLGSHINDWNLDDPALNPFWEAANELEACILVHPWDMMGFDTLPRYWMPWLVAMPAESARAICSLTMGGILDRYPKIRFGFAHGGGSFAATLGRIDHGFTVRPDLCQTNVVTPPSSYVDRLYFDSIVHDEDTLHFLISKVGLNRIALGTDYPFPLGELEPGKLIESVASFGDEERARLLHGTALEWLGRTRSDFEGEAKLGEKAE